MISQYSSIRDRVLDNIVMIQLDKLEKLANEKKMITPYQAFKSIKKQYIEFLIATCVASTVGTLISPPSLQVKELWQMHLLETESYDALSTLVVGEVKAICPNLTLKKIHHSIINYQGEGEDRLRATESLYDKLGFDFIHEELKKKNGQQPQQGQLQEQQQEQEQHLQQRSKKRKLEENDGESLQSGETVSDSLQSEETASEDPFRFYVTDTPTKKKLAFQVRPYTTVDTLMGIIVEKVGVERENLGLVGKGGKITKGTMAENQVGEGDTVYVVRR